MVYLSGPITAKNGYSVEDNVISAMKVYVECVKNHIVAVCIHLPAMFPTSAKIDYETWMTYDFAILDRCDAVIMLPRWRSSSGALREKASGRARNSGL